MFDNDKIEYEELDHAAVIKVIGIGGAGNNCVNRMVEDNVQGVDFIVINTDAQAIKNSKTKSRFVIGTKVTRGLGAGADPDKGKKAAEESKSKIRDIVSGSNMVFITAGMGGGTGTGAAPLVAKVAKESGALTVAIVTMPFEFEGMKRRNNAIKGLNELKKEVDSIVVISNQSALHTIGSLPLNESFRHIDNIIRQAVQTITDIIAVPSLINLDFADIETIMKNKGRALIGIGEAEGEGRVEEATRLALDSPLLDGNISGAKNAIVNITSGKNVTLHEVQDVTKIIQSQTSRDINIIWGMSLNEYLEDKIVVTVIATDFGDATAIAEPVKKTHTIDEIKAEDIKHSRERKDVYGEMDTRYDDEDIDDDEDDLPPFLRRG